MPGIEAYSHSPAPLPPTQLAYDRLQRTAALLPIHQFNDDGTILIRVELTRNGVKVLGTRTFRTEGALSKHCEFTVDWRELAFKTADPLREGLGLVAQAMGVSDAGI